MKQNPLRLFYQAALRTSFGAGILFASMMPSAQADTVGPFDKALRFTPPQYAQDPFAIPPLPPVPVEPLPFTATELWEKMRSILSEPDSNVIVRRFEDMFDQHLGAVANFVGRRDKYGHFDVFIARGNIFNLVWDTDTFGNAAKGECVNYAQVTKDVLADGWQLNDTLRHITRSDDSYTKDEKIKDKKKILIITFSGQCVHGLEFWAVNS